MAEPSMSKSMNSASSASFSKESNSLIHGNNGIIDRVFPIFDQMMQKTRFPSWIMTIVSSFLLAQILSVTLWIYTPIFEQSTGKWEKFYNILIEIISFQNPLNRTGTLSPILIVNICVAVLSLLWIIGMIFYNKVFYEIPAYLLYITSFIIDIVDPLFIMPCVYLVNHGITSFQYETNSLYTLEVVIGGVSYAALITIFMLSTFLKSRSVVLTNLTFPLFDYFSVTTWILATSLFSIVSAIFEFFAEWIYVIGDVVHMILTLYICYRLTFVPFYEEWRNTICMAFGLTTIVMDINYLVIYFVDAFNYNYTIIVCLVSMIVFYIISKIYFVRKIKKIKRELTANEERNSNVIEYLNSLKLLKSPQHAMMYIVVGLAELCDYFVDGHVMECVMNSSLEEAIPTVLQMVTLFPSESRHLNILYKKVIMKRKLSLVDRFLIYQVFHIKLRRLILDTKETLETFSKLKQKNEQCKSAIRDFWDKNNCDEKYLSTLGEMIADINRYFKSTLSNNPNNLRIRNEYANFLLECKCEFPNSIRQTVIAESIGDGRNFNVDVSFRSLINKFPIYLKDGILDTKGNIVRNNNNQNSKGSQSSANSNGSTNSSSLFESMSIDVEKQEIVCKKVLRDSKVRLAFNNAVSGLKPKQSKFIVIQCIFNIVLILVFFIGYFLFFRSKISWRKTSYKEIENSCYSICFNVMTNIYTLVVFAFQNGRFDGNELRIGDITVDNLQPLVPIDITFPQMIFYCIDTSRKYFDSLLNELAEMARNTNVYEILPVLLKTITNFHVCDGGEPIATIPGSLKLQLAAVDYMQNSIAGDYNQGVLITNIFKDNNYCQIAKNIPTITANADETFTGLLNYNIKMSKDYQEYFTIWCIVGSVLMLVLMTVPSMVIIYTYNRTVRKLIKVLISLQNSVKEDAKKPLSLTDEDNSDVETATGNIQHSNTLVYTAIFYFIIIFAIIAIYILLCYEGIKLDKDLTTISYWYQYSCQRLPLAAQIGSNTVQLLMLNGSLENKIITNDEIIKNAESDLKSLVKVNKLLVYGDDNLKPSLRYDESFDEIQIKNICEMKKEPETIHDMYACTGINNLVEVFKNVIEDVLKSPQSYGGTLSTVTGTNVVHMLRSHLYPIISEATTRCSEMMEKRFDRGMTDSIVFLVIGLVLTFVLFVIPWFVRKFVNDNFKVLLILLQHLPPQSIINTPEIIEFFKGRGTSTKEKMSIQKSIVMDANECILITNESSVVEIVNKSVQENIGLTPDQMLGQEIVNFVSDQDQQKLKQQIDLMTSGQGSLFWQDHISFNDDNNEQIPFAITMIGMKDSNDNLNSIVFILTNELEEIQKRKEAEEAKAKSEKLLYQILPKNIVVRLNGGETDISFTINSATIFFIDIVKFSNYASLLTPSEIMSNLSLVFATFDSIVSKYTTITKIKLIGDVYMAAAGLFMEEDSPQKHAEEAVRCCLECSKSMDDINYKLNASLEVRIGCNSGGPLIGGVLGTDKPTFDIIGDPINVAARLQSTDIPGNVQISGNTKELIQNLDFVIEERGEIYLKGKGNRMTYFVKLPVKNDGESSFMLNLDMNK
ncbi:Adenylate and Guanylate cyclase catalytic domain containing protein [Trichomonas vaginalis G3]|uniref:Adenylate and Guanylate cyclase catalytic domain containing protein n=1 Tax=Trichomonas vaginalis (strain ATCC PRA-98 / G3) TaxID=412133 RepID=A2FW09_TRIV3|nr:adenylate cyclase type 1 family [Trichomonas vaginalis G3]EAX90900.1 Adenylate and Guanylate cyclase catalytic domain containing protein [Trichomonas vaginalis G3]KAI5509141.1 adenylate cyclase type 1 family [Trichomonas vaginalis G3]|eukprot:XP_001303830.1 Adenylate and Guanylate cyclase catalytic domain containing protein [Trichomonas vaginalis G3]